MRHLKWHLTLAYQDSPLARCTFKTDKTQLTFWWPFVTSDIQSCQCQVYFRLSWQQIQQDRLYLFGLLGEVVTICRWQNLTTFVLSLGTGLQSHCDERVLNCQLLRGGVGYVILCNDIKKVSSVSVRTECGGGGFFYQYLEGDVPTSCSVSISKAFIFVLFQWW